MQILLSIVHAVQLISAIAMIGLVLIQHGKGADMGASFGSGASGSLFGATGSANFLSRSTAACATLFFLCTLGLAFLTAERPASNEAPTILERAVGVDPMASAASGVAGIPGAAPGTATVPADAASAAASAATPGATSGAATAASGAGAIPTK